MTNRDLLKEAIADAKAIKETAIANAKAALEESFTPHLMSRLAAKINEMDSYYEEDDTLEEVNDELEEMKDEMKEYAEEQPSRDMDGDGDVDANDVKMMKEFNSEEEMEEIDLDELLAELDEETVTEAKEEEEETEEEGEEEIDLENMSEEDLKNFIEGVIEDMIADGEIEAGHEGMEDEAGAEDEGEELDEDFNIDEILAELKGEEEMEEGMKKEETEAMKSELKEAYAAIKTLRTELNEINVLNAKLLYTNKIFKAKNLTESEKVKVLTAFDKATSKKEAQLVYETLVEGLKSKPKSPIKENLGRASKPAGMAIKKPILESNDMVTRFQKLAGII
jgi:pilus assembly protein FimV